MPDFLARLHHARSVTAGCLCVGLDPDPDRLPTPLRALPTVEALRELNAAAIVATAPFAAAFKLNAAFYEAHGLRGIELLYETVALVREHAPHAIVIADSKRGDIGNTARFYAKAAFDDLGADAITVAPYMGSDSVEPFMEWPDRCAFVLARTSNPGARDFQHLECEGRPLFEHVVEKVAGWNEGATGTAGLVVGATDVHALRQIRLIAPDLPLLVPGVGRQGGDPQAVVAAAGLGTPLLVNSSRDILYASSGSDYAAAAGEAARGLRDLLR